MTNSKKKEWLEDAANGTYVECQIEWLDTKQRENVTIKMNEESDDDDNIIFYYCSDVYDFEELFEKDNGEDFYIVDVYDVY